MAGLLSGLDEEQLRLPSDSFPGEICYPNRCSVPKSEADHFSSELISSMEALAHRLAFATLDENHYPAVKSPTTDLTSLSQVNYQRIIQGNPCFTYPDFRVTDFARKPVQNVSKPVLSSAHLLVRPGHRQLRVNGLVSPRLGNQSRGLPFRVVGSGASGFIRESGGTGVFLPRVARTEACCKWKPNVEAIEGRPPSRRGGGGGGAVGRHGALNIPQRTRKLLSPEVALPSEWTY